MTAEELAEGMRDLRDPLPVRKPDTEAEAELRAAIEAVRAKVAAEPPTPEPAPAKSKPQQALDGLYASIAATVDCHDGLIGVEWGGVASLVHALSHEASLEEIRGQHAGVPVAEVAASLGVEVTA